MAIEMINATPGVVKAIRILRPCLVHGTALKRGAEVRVPEAAAYDLVHAGQAQFQPDRPRPPAKAHALHGARDSQARPDPVVDHSEMLAPRVVSGHQSARPVDVPGHLIDESAD